MKIPSWIKYISGLWTLGFLSLFVIVPIFHLFLTASLFSGNWDHFFEDSTLSLVKATWGQAFWSTLLSAAIGAPIGLWFGRMPNGNIRALARAMLAVPYGIPTVISGLTWIIWLGRTGLLAQSGIHLDLAYSYSAIIIAHVFFNAPWIALIVSESRSRISEQEVEAALTLGANHKKVISNIIWPKMRFAFFGACTQVMSFCLMSFALVLILGGGPPVQTLETKIFSFLRYGAVQLQGASEVACWELILTLIPWGLFLFFQKKKKNFFNVKTDLKLKPTAPSLAQSLAMLGIGVFWILPYFFVFNSKVVSWFVDSQWRTQLVQPLVVSLKLTLLASSLMLLTTLAAIITLSFLRKRDFIFNLCGVFFTLPSGMSALVLGLGIWISYGKWVDPFEGSLLLIAALQATLFFPFAFRSLWPIAEEVSIKQIEAAVTLGLTPVRAFLFIEWPKWKFPLLVVFLATLGASLGEVASVSLFYSEKMVPLPLLITRWMSQYRFEEAQAVAGILFLLSLIIVSFSLYFFSVKLKSQKVLGVQ